MMGVPPEASAMTAQEVVNELKTMANPTIKRIYMNHGAKEPFLGVKIEDMKKIQKRVKVDYQLALDLYSTGIGDAMYLAGLIADDAKMTKKDLQRWVQEAHVFSFMLSAYTVPWVASGSAHGRELGLKWIESKKEYIAVSGWATINSLVSTKPDDQLDIAELRQLLKRVEKTIHDQPNLVRYVMNGFVIAVGGFVKALTKEARAVAKKIGKVHVDMGDTSCKVPDATEYIKKVEKAGKLGVKRKMAKC
jgi:3-methyladenine DNA glycosylase AlkD